jgi:hypothetical protein
VVGHSDVALAAGSANRKRTILTFGGNAPLSRRDSVLERLALFGPRVALSGVLVPHDRPLSAIDTKLTVPTLRLVTRVLGLPQQGEHSRTVLKS